MLRVLGWLLYRLWRIVTFPPRLAWRIFMLPWRLQRRKISVQLIYSQVLVVILTILLLETVAIAIAVGLYTIGIIDDEALDFSVGQRTQAVAVAFSVQDIGDALADDAPIPEDTRDEARQQLQALIAGSFPPGEPPVEPGNLVEDEPNIAYGLVTDRDGTVVVSTDASWAAVGTTVDSIAFPETARITRRAISRDDEPIAFGNRYVQDVEDRTTVASHPILRDGDVVGAVTLQGVRAPKASLGDIIEPSTVSGFAITNGIVLAILSVPALLVSIPVGVWRARKISRRVTDLADAADAMAAGDLSKRIDVRGEDEISRVSIRFNDMIERLQETDSARKSFVANVSHELRTPVAIIQGNLEQMLDVDEGDEDRVAMEQHRKLDMLYQETLTLSRLIDDLFTLARIEEAQLPLEALPFRLDDIVGQVLEGIKGVAWEQRRVSVESLVAANLPPVAGDETRVRQILGNLLYNALRHTQEGGLIIVNAQANAIPGMVEVSVSDTGIGMTEEQLTRVFERFYQAERTGRNAGGSGLGLTIVKQLVEAQHGTVSVESTLGQGTTFRFTLPIAP